MVGEDDTTPKQSDAWNLWRTGAEELLDRLLNFAIAHHFKGDHDRGRAASDVADKVVDYLERLGDSDMSKDDVRVLRREQFIELNGEALGVMAGIEIPDACHTCPKRKGAR